MKRYLPAILVAGCAAALVFGIFQLFKLRFETGDVYPEYSSLRADPLGTMALYESLDKMPGVSVQRDHTTANRLPQGKDTTYLHIAASQYEWKYLRDETYQEVERFVRDGGRLVITLQGESADPFSKSPKADPDEDKTDSKPKKKSSKKKVEEETGYTSLEDRWGVKFWLLNLPANDEQVYEPVRVDRLTDQPLPESLQWHSGLVFTNLPDSWQTIYARGTNPVVIERKFGRGSVVIATDSYLVSNEALQKDRHPEFLAWLVGPSRTVVFDEAHLGVMDESGVAVLARKYRLHWLVVGLIALAGLFIWKNSLSLVPARAADRHREYVVGKDAAAGFVNLLRRSISSRELLSLCFAEWKKSIAPTRKYSTARLREAEAVFQQETQLGFAERDPVRVYKTISGILESRKATSLPQPATDNGQRTTHQT